MTWLLLALSLLLASAAVAQPQPPIPTRERQDRRATLPATPAEPMLELYVAANNLTTVGFNATLDRDSLVVDRTRFKWAQVSDSFLLLEPFADLASDDKLIVQIGFKDRALPAKAVLAVTSKAHVMDGKVEVDRRANTPEALLAALTQKEAELEELKARCAGSSPAELALSEWLTEKSVPVLFTVEETTADANGPNVYQAVGYPGTRSAIVAIRLLNLPGQKPWAVGQARITSSNGTPATVLWVQMKPAELAPGKEGLVVVETKTSPWEDRKPFSVELVGASNSPRRISMNLTKL